MLKSSDDSTLPLFAVISFFILLVAALFISHPANNAEVMEFAESTAIKKIPQCEQMALSFAQTFFFKETVCCKVTIVQLLLLFN